jgi:hypothetical protein
MGEAKRRRGDRRTGDRAGEGRGGGTVVLLKMAGRRRDP